MIIFCIYRGKQKTTTDQFASQHHNITSPIHPRDKQKCSNFNTNEHSDINTDKHTHTDQYPNKYADTNRDSNTDTESNQYPNSNEHPNTDKHTHAHQYSDEYTNTNKYTNINTNSDNDPNQRSDKYTNIDPNRNADRTGSDANTNNAANLPDSNSLPLPGAGTKFDPQPFTGNCGYVKCKFAPILGNGQLGDQHGGFLLPGSR